MKKKDILKDKSIKQISVENIGSISDIKTVGIIEDTRGSGFSNIVLPIILVIIGSSILFAALYFAFNYKLVEGNVTGEAHVAGFSIVEDDYTPYSYITEGSVVYYDGSNSNFLNLKKDYSVGVINTIKEGKCYVTANNREVYINNTQINYVLENG